MFVSRRAAPRQKLSTRGRFLPLGVALGCAWILTATEESHGQAQTMAAVSIAGQTFATVEEALGAAIAGDTVVLGAGTLFPAAPLAVPAGVSLEGASPGQTLIDAAGLEAGMVVTGSAASMGAVTTTIRGVAIAGAARGIEVKGAHGVVIRNVILRDSSDSGLFVSSDAEASLVSATLVRNGTGVAGVGLVHVRNTIITAGVNGLVAGSEGAIVSSYNDLFENQGAAYSQVRRGIGDMSFQVSFVGFQNDDFRLTDAQKVTDRGDPEDGFAAEPAPNGGRVNLGAFGNTAEAEISPDPTADGGSGCRVGGAAPIRLGWPDRCGAVLVLAAGLLGWALRPVRTR